MPIFFCFTCIFWICLINSHQNTRQFTINENIVQIENFLKYSRLRVLSITSFQTKYSNATPTSFSRNKWAQALSHRICISVVSCLSMQCLWPLQFSVLAAQLIGLLLRAKIYLGRCKNIFFKYEKSVFQTSPPPMKLLSTSNFSILFRA